MALRRQTTYSWYPPGDEAAYRRPLRAHSVPLGKLDADVLGGLYESYVDEIDRDRLGQFYTPRAVVSSCSPPASARRGRVPLEGDDGEPRRVLDFATGSGGFVVEAARRIIDEGAIAGPTPRA